jgi:CRISPR-associated endonuclease/helicase Cas3
MTLPTGMGKTLCSLNWALHHAKVHTNIKRIVIVLPFLSIIDQTAKELKSIFKDHDVILEHHSNVI